MKKQQITLKDDEILNISDASQVLKTRLGGGWGLDTVRTRIGQGKPFNWVEGYHYYRVSGKITSLNVSAIVREMSVRSEFD